MPHSHIQKEIDFHVEVLRYQATVPLSSSQSPGLQIMADPSTRILDHIVHLTPPGTLEDAIGAFQNLGFTSVFHRSSLTSLTEQLKRSLRQRISGGNPCRREDRKRPRTVRGWHLPRAHPLHFPSPRGRSEPVGAQTAGVDRLRVSREQRNTLDRRDDQRACGRGWERGALCS